MRTDPMIPVSGSSGSHPKPLRFMPKDITMTNSKKLKAKDLASMKGGAAKATAKPSGLAKASAGRVSPKAVNLGAKKP